MTQATVGDLFGGPGNAEPRYSGWLPATAAFITALTIYASSASPYPSTGDSAEMQVVPYILGIAHPTGFPLFTLVGWAFTHALPFGTVAWRMNVLSGLCVAAAAAGGVYIALEIGAAQTEAFLGAMVFALSAMAWNKGTHADAHSMSLAFITFSLLFVLRSGRSGIERNLLVSCLFAGLGLATHPEAIWCLPAIGVAALWRRAHRRVVLVAVAALLLPLTLYAYLPLRSAYVAVHALDPAAAAPVYGTSVWNSNDPQSVSGFLDEVSGRQFDAPGTLFALIDFRQYPGAFAFWWQRLQPQMPLIAVVLAALGAVYLVRFDRRSATILVAGILPVVPFLNAYRSVESDVDRYFLSSLVVVSALAATASRIPIARSSKRTRSIVACALLAIVALTQLQANRGRFGGHLETGGQGAINTVQHDVPDGSIVVAYWLDATSLEYGAYVERSLGSRVFVTGWPGEFAARYRSWSAVKPVYIFAAASALDNVRSSLPAAWLTDHVSSDRYHHVILVRVTLPEARGAGPTSRHLKPQISDKTSK